MTTESESATWLVKSNGRILGPYTAKDVVRLLESRTVVALDEISSPAKRWNYIRDTPAFSKAVEDLRVKGLGRGVDDHETATETQEIGAFTETRSATGSFLDTSTVSDDLTVKIPLDFEKDEKEIPYEDIEEQNPTSAPLHRPDYHFGVKKSHSGRSKVEESTKFLWVGTAAILLLFVAFLVQKKIIKVSFSSKSQLESHVNEGIRLLKIGDEEGALEKFKKAHVTDSHYKDIYIFLGSLFTQLEGQTLATKRLFKMVLERQGKNTKEALTGLGLAELEDGELEDAENHFNKALDQDAFFSPALINLGIVQIKKGEYLKAKNSFERVLGNGQLEARRQFLSGITHLMLSEAYLLLWEQSKDKSYLIQADKILRSYMVSRFDYKQQMLIYLAYIGVELSQSKKLEPIIVQILNVDSRLTELHRHSLLVYRRSIDWNAIFEKCRRVVEAAPSTGIVKALHAYCLFRNGNFTASEEMIVKANASLPNHPLVKATHGSILLGVNKIDQASLTIGRAQKLNLNYKYESPAIYQARLCVNVGNLSCSKNQWDQLLLNNPKSLTAIGGSAEYYAKAKNKNQAWKMIRRGEALSANFIPLLKAKELLFQDHPSPSEPLNFENL